MEPNSLPSSPALDAIATVSVALIFSARAFAAARTSASFSLCSARFGSIQRFGKAEQLYPVVSEVTSIARFNVNLITRATGVCYYQAEITCITLSLSQSRINGP